MAHYKLLLDPSKYLQPQDFPQDKEVTISRIVREKLPQREGEEEKSAPMLYILGRDGKEYARPLKVPKSVLHGLALSFGVDDAEWIGKKITVFAAKCLAFGDVEECIRVRFPADIDGKIRKWLKKRKANPSAYILEGK